MTSIESNTALPLYDSFITNNQYQKRSLHENTISEIKRHNIEPSNCNFFEEREDLNKNILKEIHSKINDDSDDKRPSIFQSMSNETLTRAKNLVQEALKNKKIFSIYGPYEKLRIILRDRGWVEKKIEEKQQIPTYPKIKSPEKKSLVNTHGDIANLQPDSNQENHSEKLYVCDNIHEIASQMVQRCVPDFIWSLKMTQIDMKNIKPNQMINHFKKAGSFTTKIGLIKSFNFLRWFEKNPDEVFPRSYIISDEDEKKAFYNDYYLTACLSMVRLTAEIKEFVPENNTIEKNEEPEELHIEMNNSKSQTKKIKPYINYDAKESGCSPVKIDRRYPEMAVQYCQWYLKNLENKDLDSKEFVLCSNKKWDEFFESFWNINFEGYGIECTEKTQNICKSLCEEIKKYHLQYNMSGTKNIWIVKPGAKSRGRGISCISKFSEFDAIFRSNSEMLIVQKYIERPLLIYNTKFDIRQWFLVTSWSPLTIWWYDDCYIRFCSQQFTLNDFNESVHLSNNSIQYKYKNGSRSRHLPDCNMWHWEDFDKYLNENGYENGWQKHILPSMKNIIIDILLCSQEEIEERQNSFELYGADFMITEGDLRTWLIEINSSPCLAPSTDITAKLTKNVLEDLIKVLFDYPQNTFCDTGEFHLLYKQSPFLKSLITQSYDLSVIGRGIKKPISLSFTSSKDIEKHNHKVLYNDNSLLKMKIRNFIEGEGMNFKHKFNEPNKRYNRNYGKLTQEIKYSHPEVSNQPLGVKRSRTQSLIHTHALNNNDTIKQHNPLEQNNSLAAKNLMIEEEKNENFPAIKSKSMEKPNDKLKQVAEKNVKPGYFYDNTRASKINFLRNLDGKTYKRIDQLIKAYMPKIANQ